MKIKYTQLSHQREFHQDLISKQLLLTSGYGGGKSYALVMKLLQLSYLNAPYPGGLFSPTIPEYKKDMLPLFIEILEANQIQYDYHKTDKIWTFPWSMGPLYVFTCEKRIKGPTLAYGGINEPGLISHERFKEVIGRIRIREAKYRQLALAGTPEGRSNWLYEHFIEEKKGTVIYGDTRKNIFISEDYVKNLEENYDSIMLQSYLEGKFVSLHNSLFYYAFSREKNTDQSLKYDPNLSIDIGMDFNVEHMTCSMWHCDDYNAHAFDEIVIPNNAKTQKLCDAIKARGYNPANCTVYPDTAGKSRDTRSNYSDIEIIRQNGFKVRFKPRAPFFRDRQNAVNNMLDKGRLKINPKKCVTLLKDLEGVEQDTADLSKIKTNPKLTHASDGMDYMIDLKFPLAGKKPITMTPR